ncbi:MAG: SDR family NAD(P)-dependent oxidoreductase [Acidimicrobiales bacterium]
MADIGYDGQVAIITGSGGGLGREHALELARRGARVVVNDLGGSVSGEGHEEGPAHKTAQEINDLGGIAVADTNSVATPEGGQAIVQTALDEFGTVDIVINNAGILRDKTFHNMTPELLNPVIDVHLRGAFYVTQPAYVIMREKGYGRIVNTSSNSGILGNFGQSNYGAAKMGLVGFTRVLANEGRKYNIKANAIAPVAKTRMTEELFGAAGDPLDPKLITPVVAWLVSSEVDVSGEIYSVAGGLVARFFIGLTPGYFNPNLTVEDVRDHFAEIRDEEGYIVPEGPNDELQKIFQTVTGQQG